MKKTSRIRSSNPIILFNRRLSKNTGKKPRHWSKKNLLLFQTLKMSPVWYY